MKEQAQKYGAGIETGPVTRLDRDRRRLRRRMGSRPGDRANRPARHRGAATAGRRMDEDSARRGAGARPDPLLPDLRRLRGHRPKVGVIGSGSHGVAEAMFLRGYTADLTLIAPDRAHEPRPRRPGPARGARHRAASTGRARGVAIDERLHRRRHRRGPPHVRQRLSRARLDVHSSWPGRSARADRRNRLHPGRRAPAHQRRRDLCRRRRGHRPRPDQPRDGRRRRRGDDDPQRPGGRVEPMRSLQAWDGLRRGRPDRRRSCRRSKSAMPVADRDHERACRRAARSRARRRRRNSRPRRRCRAARPRRSRRAGRSGRRDNIRPRRAAAAPSAGTVSGAAQRLGGGAVGDLGEAGDRRRRRRLDRPRGSASDRRPEARCAACRLSTPSANSFRRTSPVTPCAPATAARVTVASGQGLALGLLGALLGGRLFGGAFGRRFGGLALIGASSAGVGLLGGSLLGRSFGSSFLGRSRFARRLPRQDSAASAAASSAGPLPRPQLPRPASDGSSAAASSARPLRRALGRGFLGRSLFGGSFLGRSLFGRFRPHFLSRLPRPVPRRAPRRPRPPWRHAPRRAPWPSRPARPCSGCCARRAP